MGKKNQPDQKPSEVAAGMSVAIVGLSLLVFSFFNTGLPSPANKGTALGGLICLGVGLITMAKALMQARKLPKQEIMRLAEERAGLLTLSEITTALNIDPDLARRTLVALAKDGIATQRWQEFRKNLWEFPDYMKLPITESIEMAKSKGGRLSVQDLLASGYSSEIAKQTLNTLSEKGLAQQDPSATSGDVVVTTQ